MMPEVDPVLSGATPLQRTDRKLPWFAVARWTGSLAALTLAPKCVLCVAGYLGLAAGLGLTGVEICGGTANGAGLSLPSVAPVLGLLGLSISSVLLGRRIFRNRSRARVRNKVGRSFSQ